MIRLGRMTDYGVGLMTRLARIQAPEPMNARDLAATTGMPLPTVSKILKLLCQGELLVSRRGVGGGYRLARHPDEITLAEMVHALEGPPAITECTAEGACSCEYQTGCGLQKHWSGINRQLQASLERVTLAQMAAEASSNMPLNSGKRSVQR